MEPSDRIELSVAHYERARPPPEKAIDGGPCQNRTDSHSLQRSDPTNKRRDLVGAAPEDRTLLQRYVTPRLSTRKRERHMEPKERIELSATYLPSRRSTTDLLRHGFVRYFPIPMSRLPTLAKELCPLRSVTLEGFSFTPGRNPHGRGTFDLRYGAAGLRVYLCGVGMSPPRCWRIDWDSNPRACYGQNP